MRLSHRQSLPFGLLCIAGFFGIASSAEAHVGFPGMADLWNGALHPIVDVTQAITLVAMGCILARVIGSSAEVASVPFSITNFSLPSDPFVLFHLSFAMGLGFGLLLLPPATEILGPLALAASGLVLINPRGVFTARSVAAERTTVALAAFVGLAFAAAIPAEVTRLVFACGVFFAALLIPLYASAFWERFQRPWFTTASQIAGSWIIAVALMLLGAAIREGLYP